MGKIYKHKDYDGYGFTKSGLVYSFFKVGGRGQKQKEPYLKSQSKNSKYITVVVGGKRVAVHRLIYGVFKGKPKPGYQIHHKDGNTLNNRLSNLEALTIKEHNELEAKLGKKARGQRVNTSKLSDVQTKQLREDANSGLSISELVLKYKISRSQVHKIKTYRSRNFDTIE